MLEKQDIEREFFIQKWAPHLAAGVLLVAIAIYASQFHGSLSPEQSTWGQFGDFVGGAVNPIIGFFTIWLLAVSLRQNHKALSQANTALAQANAELELTRQSIEQATSIQIATEAALKRQIEIAEHSRDMNNAIVLMRHFDEVSISSGQRIEDLSKKDYTGRIPTSNQMKIEIFELNQRDAGANREEMGSIVKKEFARLVDKYSNSETTS